MAAAAVPSVIVNLKVLSRDNYKEWSFKVKTYLLAEDLWKVVTSKPPTEGRVPQAYFDAWSKDNAKALHTIHISCGENAYAFIENINVAKAAWEILAKEFNPTEVSHDADVRNLLKKINRTMVNGDVGPKKDTEIQAVEGGESSNPNLMYEPFFKNVDDRNWHAVIEFIKIHPEAVRERHPSAGWTALHNAVGDEEVDIVKELVQLMTMEDLEIKDNHGFTVLSRAVIGKDTDKMVEIVKCLVEKNNKLLTIRNSIDDIPLVRAFEQENWRMTAYIYSVTPLETLSDGEAAQLISSGFFHKSLDIPLDLIRYNPRLGITKDRFGRSPVFQLAVTRSAFLSGSRLRFWEQWIYDCIHVQPTPTKDFKKEPTTNINHTCINVQTLERCQGNQRHLIFSGICNAVGHFFRELLMTNLLKLVGINRLYQMKLFHVQSLEILHRICEVLKSTEDIDMNHMIIQSGRAIFMAVKLGQVEFMTHISKANRMFQFITDVDGRTFFQLAVECRQEKIYSLIYGLDKDRQQNFASKRDESMNNMLHSIAKLSSLAQIDQIRGAALQMQRELQWFKEVENIAGVFGQEYMNTQQYNNDPYPINVRELFTKEHRELVKEGEKSMKETATSCTVVGALIVTIMFEAAFTVPGGNGDTGFPNFLDQKAFKIFIASDAISLFFGTTSVMIFLGMLTSRYAEDDFLKSLPTKMILGLSTLFISIAAMMIAFSSALFLMLPGESWIAFPAILLSIVPIASFVWMQFPLLVDIFISTYGAGPFDKKVQRWG